MAGVAGIELATPAMSRRRVMVIFSLEIRGGLLIRLAQDLPN